MLLNIKNIILYNFLTGCASMQTNWNLKFRVYSIIKDLKQKYFNFLTKIYRVFVIAHEKVKKFQVLRKCPLLFFSLSEKFSQKNIYVSFPQRYFSLIREVFKKKKKKIRERFHKNEFSMTSYVLHKKYFDNFFFLIK